MCIYYKVFSDDVYHEEDAVISAALPISWPCCVATVRVAAGVGDGDKSACCV